MSLRGRSGALVSERLGCLSLAHCAASFQVALGCAVFSAGRGRRGESGSAGILGQARSSGAPGSGAPAASVRGSPGLGAGVAWLGPLADFSPCPGAVGNRSLRASVKSFYIFL